MKIKAGQWYYIADGRAFNCALDGSITIVTKDPPHDGTAARELIDVEDEPVTVAEADAAMEAWHRGHDAQPKGKGKPE